MSLNILVCAKQVPDNDNAKVDFKTGNLIRESAKGKFNEDDLNALTQALALKKKYMDVTVTVLSMGPASASDILFEAAARGADRTILVSDSSFRGADTWATSEILKMAASKAGSFDIVFTGRQSSDGDTAQVGPQLAQKMGIPHVSSISEFEYIESEHMAVVKRETEIDAVKLPALFTCSGKLNTVGYIDMPGIFREKNIEIFDAADLDIGLVESKTEVLGTFAIKPKQPGYIVPGSTASEKVLNVLKGLKEDKVI